MARPSDNHGDTWDPDRDPDSVDEDDRPRYRDAREIGRGAMGRVLRVWDGSLGRRVAYKVMRRKIRSAAARRRFLREARITARLEHPGIAPVYELGRDDEGAPYYTMRFIEGGSMADALRSTADLAERLALLPRFVDACQAVAYAHDRGVVHRDLKPANIMVGDFGQTLVVDWGLAKGADDDEVADDTTTAGSAASGATQAGTVMGSPAYMSPEQARGDLGAVDARSDVWSLGVVLFEILTGGRPFQGRTGDETLQFVRTAEVPTVASRVGGVPTELAAICARALQRPPEARYQTAAELADEVEAWLTGGWVGAYRYSAWERVRRLAARHRLLVGLSLTSAVALSTTGAVAVREVVAERDRAQAAEAEGRRHLAEAFAGKAQGALDSGDVVQAELFAAAALDLNERADARGVLARTRAMWRPQLRAELGPAGGCRDLAAWPDGSAIVCAGTEGLSAWTAAGIELWRTEDTHAFAVAVAPDGHTVAVLTRGRMELVDARTGNTRASHVAEHGGTRCGLAWRLDASRVAYGLRSAIVVRAADGEPLGQISSKGTATGLAWDGEDLVASLLDGRMYRYDANTGEVQVSAGDRIATSGLYHLSAHADAGVAAVGSGRSGVHLLDLQTLELRAAVAGHDGPVLTTAMSPSGDWLVTTGEDGTLRVVHVAAAREALGLKLHAGSRMSVAFLDEQTLAAATPGAPIRIWHLPEERASTTLGDGLHGQSSAGFSPDGARAAVSTGEGHIDVFDRASGHSHARRFDVSDSVLRQVVWMGPRTLAIADMRERLVVWPLDGEPTTWLEGFRPMSLAFDRSRGHLYAASIDGLLRRWEGDREPAEVWVGAEGEALWEVVVSADGSALAWTDVEDDLVAVSLPERTPLLARHFDVGPRAIALSPDGTLLAWSQEDRGIEVVELSSGARLGTASGPRHAVDDLEFSPDGRWLLAASWDQRTWVWDAVTLELRAVLADHEHRVVDAEVAPDGHTLATASWDGTTRLWDLRALEADPRRVMAELEVELGVRLEGARMVTTAR